MINERMRRPCTCQTSRAVMIGCQARGARCEARGARSMTGSKAAPEVPRGLVPCRLVMSRAPPTRAARHLCAGCVHRRRSSPHGLGCFTHSGAMRADMDTRIKMPVKMRVRCTVLRRSRTSVIHAHDPTPPRAPRATAHAHGATAAVGPRGRSAARAGVRTRRSRRGRYVRSRRHARRVDRPGRSRFPPYSIPTWCCGSGCAVRP